MTRRDSVSDAPQRVAIWHGPATCRVLCLSHFIPSSLADAHHASHVLASPYPLRFSILRLSYAFFFHFLPAWINLFITWVPDFRNSRTLVLFLTVFDLCLSDYSQSPAPMFSISRPPGLRACCAHNNPTAASRCAVTDLLLEMWAQ
jgi:hypothetical protein